MSEINKELENEIAEMLKNNDGLPLDDSEIASKAKEIASRYGAVSEEKKKELIGQGRNQARWDNVGQRFTKAFTSRVETKKNGKITVEQNEQMEEVWKNFITKIQKLSPDEVDTIIDSEKELNKLMTKTIDGYRLIGEKPKVKTSENNNSSAEEEANYNDEHSMKGDLEGQDHNESEAPELDKTLEAQLNKLYDARVEIDVEALEDVAKKIPEIEKAAGVKNQSFVVGEPNLELSRIGNPTG